MKARRIGVRALRQSLSRYLRKVEAGDSFEVTEHGRPVAVLSPVPVAATPLERLAAAGRLTLPQRDLLELGDPPRSSCPLSRALDEQRADRL